MLKDNVGRFVYDDAYMDMYAPYYAHARKIPSNANVLIIGANDGIIADPTWQVWQDSWNGYFVEPNPYAHERLKRNRSGTYIPYAVSSTTDVMTLYTMTPEAAKAYEQIGADGSCLTSFDRRHLEIRLLENLGKTTSEMGLENMIQPIAISCKTVKDILIEYQIPEVHLVQIDIEGMEYQVVPQCFDIGAEVVLWEHRHLSKLRKSELKWLAKSAGYETQDLRLDTFAYKL